MNLFERRRVRKSAEEVLRHCHHVRNMREDLLAPTDVQRLCDGEAALKAAIKSSDPAAMEKAADDLYAAANRVAPARSFHGFRENLEILVVAIAVAMAFRAYFIQPFKIPTGSMQPTLFGIHSDGNHRATVMDRVPLKFAKWLVYGEWYREVKVRIPGQLSNPYTKGGQDDPSVYYVNVGSVSYKVPKDAMLQYRPGQYLEANSILWTGIVTAGDHVFVNKVRWNFQAPKRGQIMVFSTQGIMGLIPGTHYIKRMVGVPGDELEIRAPVLMVNGKEAQEPTMRKIGHHEPPYDKYPYNNGYIAAEVHDAMCLKAPGDVLALGTGEYFGLGDNTGNSRDGRYWGTVPHKNLVGPAFMVYWPASSRWGFTR